MKLSCLLCFAIAAAIAVQHAALADKLVSSDEAVVRALNLANEYNSAVRPPPDDDRANIINVYMYLNSLAKVDSTSLEVTIKLWLHTSWIDRRVKWFGRFNSSLDNVSIIHLPSSMLWQPGLKFYNALSGSIFAVGPNVMDVESNGLVMLGTGMVVTFKCLMDIQYFPFDKQVCHLRLVSMQQIFGSVRVQAKPFFANDSPSSYLISNNEFCILDVKMSIEKIPSNDSATLAIRFQRKPTFYVVNLILPSVFLLAISAIAFRLPPDCGERVSFSITIVLSMCVFLQLAGNYIPTQSESVPILSLYFLALVLMTVMNVLCNAFVLACQLKQQSGAHVSNFLIRALFLNRLVLGKFCSRQKGPACVPQEPQSQHAEQSCSSGLRGNEWEIVVSSADRIFFWIYAALSTIIVVTAFGFQAALIEDSCIK